MKRRLVGVVVLAIVVVPLPGSAKETCGASTDVSGGVSDGGAVEVIGSHTSDCPRRTSDDTGYPREYWTTQDIFWGRTGGCPDGMVEGIRRYWVVTSPGAEPLHAYDAPACVPIPGAGEDVQVDPADIEAILRGVLPQPTVARDPYADGLVGLETYFWYAGGDLHTVDHDGDPATPPRHGWTGTTSANGITITATLYVDRFAWQVEPGRELSATVPGTPDDPAATHTYTTTGTYDLVASTTWSGTYTWSITAAPAPGDAAAAASGTGTLDGVTLSSPPQPFRVRELRAVPAQDHAGH